MPAWAVWLLSTALLGVGFLGAWLPGLPGLPLMAIGALLHKLCLPRLLSWWTVALFIAVALLGLVLDFLGTLYASRKAGVTRVGTVGALLGGIIGLFFTLPGLLLGPFLGAVLAELFVSKRSVQEALKAGIGAGLGFLAGTVGKGLLAVGLVMLFLVDAFLL
jgi:hypothetical protein